MRVRWRLTDTIGRGLQLAELSAKHWSVLASRFEEGFFERFKDDLQTLQSSLSAAECERVGKESLTAGQNEALAHGAKTVMAVRAMVRARFESARPIKTQFGVGMKLRAGSVSSVSSALEILLKAAEAEPEAARSAGLLPSDLQAIQQAFEHLNGANARQEGSKFAARVAVQDRNIVQLRVEQAMNRLLSAARLAFIDQPDVAELFESLRPLPRGKHRRKPEGEAPAAQVEVEPKAG